MHLQALELTDEEIDAVSGAVSIYTVGYAFGQGVRAIVEFLTIPGDAQGDVVWIGS